MKLRSLAGMLGGVVALASTVACSELESGGESYCDLNPDDPGCNLSGMDVRPDPWDCLDQAPTPLPTPTAGKLVAFIQPVLEWGSRQSMASRGSVPGSPPLQALLCFSNDITCQRPITGAYTVREGMLGPNPLPPTIPAGATAVPVPEGFDGFIKFDVATPAGSPEEQQFLSDAYYLGGAISGDVSFGGPILMIQKGLRGSILQASFPGVDPTVAINRGVLGFSVYDCNGDPVQDALIELNIAGQVPQGVVPFQLPASRIPVARPQDTQLYTAASGLGGFLNVQPGVNVQVLAYRNGDQQPFGSVELGSVAGQLSFGPIRPDNVLGANVVNSTPLAADMMMGN